MSETAFYYRLGFFAAILALMAVWEALCPRRGREAPRLKRWPTNLALVAANAIMVRVIVLAGIPLLAVAAAAWAEETGIGVFNMIAVPRWGAVVVSVILLDGLIYGQHALMHRVGFLWRMHRVHHTDREVDVTTAGRFHPFEIAVSMVIKVTAVTLLGAPAESVLIFEIILNGMALFNHASVRLPRGWDAILRRLVVTPDMHRVHHSIVPAEMNSNFGFNLSLWDRAFGTYRAAPGLGHDGVILGLPDVRDDAPTRLLWTLHLPFRG